MGNNMMSSCARDNTQPIVDDDKVKEEKKL